MAKKKRAVPGINSSSTADIAFMLLIFFLITTSMDTDRGLARRLPPPPEQNQKDDNILKKERNVLQVRLNKDDQLMCGKEYIDIKQLREKAKEFIATLVSIKPLPGLHLTTTREQHWPDKTGWTQLIELATKTIAEGELDKVVLARATDLHFASPVNAAAMMAASRRLNLNCYHFYMAFDGENAFLGSSPERLWRRRDKALRTEALAGTVANHPDDKQAQRLGEWLMADDKNQRENMLVVEDICQRLQADTQTLDVLPPQVLRLRKVQHLRRCIWTSLNKADDVICLHQLQPTAAVAGLPRDLARQFIARHEPFTREWYAGSAGYLSLQQSEFCVSLRSAKISGNVVRLYAGAGIVRGSDPEQEWQEIDNKAAGLRTLLQME